MQDKEVLKLLESLKDDPVLGGDFDFKKSWSTFAHQHGFNPTVQVRHYTFRDYVETYLWMFTHSMLKPMAAAAAVFVFAVVGSVAVAGASAQALPGERLYPMKLGLEKAQLVLALSSDQRSGLHVEFTGRRLEEMVALAAMSSPSTSANVQLAATRFKNEVVGIQEELSTGNVIPSGAQKEFAKTVGRQVEVYSSTVASTSEDLSEEVLGEVEELLEETKEQVVEIIITAHEAQQDEESAHELDVALETEIQNVVALYGDASAQAVVTAQALRDEGSYRRAFQVLKDFVFEAGLVPEE